MWEDPGRATLSSLACLTTSSAQLQGFVLELIKAGCSGGEGLAMGGTSGLQANLRAQTNRQHLKSIWRVLFPALRLSLGRDMMGPAIYVFANNQLKLFYK